MNIELSDEQKKLLVRTLAISWKVEYKEGRDPEPIGKLIEAISIGLKSEGNEQLFFDVFEEFLP